MARIDTLANFLTDVAAAIKNKTGKTDAITPANFDTEIESIEGGGSSKYAPRTITFANYTGSDLDYEVANLDTSNLTSMSQMFYSAQKITNLDISHFVTKGVTKFFGMFWNAKNLQTIILPEKFEDDKVTDAGSMFNSCGNSSTGIVINASGLKLIYAKYIIDMFASCNATTIDVSQLNPKYNCTSTARLFQNCSKLTSIDMRSFEGAYITDCSNMFNGCTVLEHLDIRSFDFVKVTSTSGMFNSVPANCEIIVKDDTAKNFILGLRSDFTNIKTLAEL